MFIDLIMLLTDSLIFNFYILHNEKHKQMINQSIYQLQSSSIFQSNQSFTVSANLPTLNVKDFQNFLIQVITDSSFFKYPLVIEDSSLLCVSQLNWKFKTIIIFPHFLPGIYDKKRKYWRKECALIQAKYAEPQGVYYSPYKISRQWSGQLG